MKTCSRPSRGSTHSAVRTTIRRRGRSGPMRRAPARVLRRPDRRPQAASAGTGNAALLPIARRGVGKRLARRERVGAVHSSRGTFGGFPGQRVERQPQAHRRIAREQKHVLAAAANHGPLSHAGRRRADAPRRSGKHIADDLVQALLEDPWPAAARSSGSSRLACQRIDVDRQPPFLPQVIPDVFVSRQARSSASTPSRSARRGDELPRHRRRRSRSPVGSSAIRAGRRPRRHAVRAPVAAQRPARQRFARIPFALAEMQAGRPARSAAAQPPQQLAASARLSRPQRRRCSIRAVRVVDRDEGRLAAHRQPHVARPGARRRRAGRGPRSRRHCSSV